MSDRRCRLHKPHNRNELRRRKTRKTIAMDLTSYQKGPSTICNSKCNKSSPTPSTLSTKKFNNNNNNHKINNNNNNYKHYPKYVEQFYIQLDRSSSTFSINSNINAFCFQVQGSFGSQIIGCNTKSSSTTTSQNTTTPTIPSSVTTTTTNTTSNTFADSWQPRKPQPVISLQPNCNLFIQNLYLLKAIPPLRKSLYSLRLDDLRPYPEVLRKSTGHRKIRKPLSDADVIFGDSIPSTRKYPRWTKSNIQWLIDLEASSGDRGARKQYKDSFYGDMCCMPFETNYLFFNSSY